MNLRASCDRPLYLSTRDCRSWFEQLRAPDALRPHLGQQPTECNGLIGVLGLSISELRGYLEDLPSPFTDEHLLSLDLFPVSCTWPHGFSWSPYIAQEKLLHLARLGGVVTDAILSPDRPPPIGICTGKSAVAFICDDAMHFTRDCVTGRAELQSLDDVYVRERI